MRKLVLLLACVLLTGCGATMQSTDGSTKSEIAETYELETVIEVLGTGRFTVSDSKSLLGGMCYFYTVYKDSETGYCFISLDTGSDERLLILLVNKDGTRKEYSDSNTNVMTPVGTSQDERIVIIRDEDTGVEYALNKKNYFIRDASLGGLR